MKKQIFDMYDKLPEGIDTDTIKPEMNIDSEKIKTEVVTMIKAGKGKKRKSSFRKKLTVTLIAAAVGTAVLGTIGVGAMGGFNEAFGERFAGERINGIYPGGNVNISTNDKVKAEFLGIAGDKNKVMAAVTVKKTDGSAFVDYDDIENTIVIPDIRTVNCLDENGQIPEQMPFFLSNSSMPQIEGGDYLYATVSAWTKMKFSSSSDYYTNENGEDVCFDYNDYDMRLTDKNTAKMIYFIGREDYTLTGETMKVKQDKIYILHKDEMLAENLVDIFLTNENGISEEKREKLASVLENEKKIVAEHKDSLKENQTIIAVTDREATVDNYNETDSRIVKRTLYTVTVTEVPVQLEGSWQLNYNSTEIDINTANGLAFENVPYEVENLKAGSFSSEITIKTDNDLSSFGDNSVYNGWVEDLLETDIEITMKKGEKLKGLWSSAPIGISDISDPRDGTRFTIEISYYRYNDYNNLTVWSNLNADEIVSMKIAGQEIIAGK